MAQDRGGRHPRQRDGGDTRVAGDVVERARADRLEGALAEARRPWLARVLDGLRRKG